MEYRSVLCPVLRDIYHACAASLCFERDWADHYGHHLCAALAVELVRIRFPGSPTDLLKNSDIALLLTYIHAALDPALLVDVFNKQAVQECYVILSHESLRLFRRLEFVGSCTFNLFMSASSFVSVIIYERVSMTAPFFSVACLTGLWALLVAVYFGVRLSGSRFRLSFASAEHDLLARLEAKRGRTETSTTSKITVTP